MTTGSDHAELVKFTQEATKILESGMFPLHKWESNIEELESEGMPNPSKILGLKWDKREDELLIEMPAYSEEAPVTKKSIVSYLGKVYDPLGIASPTMAKGKRIFREACDEQKNWNAEISETLSGEWLRWTKQLRNVRVPRSIGTNLRKIKSVHLHLFSLHMVANMARNICLALKRMPISSVTV